MNYNEIIRNKMEAKKIAQDISRLLDEVAKLRADKAGLTDTADAEIHTAEYNRQKVMQKVVAEMVAGAPYTATQIHNMYMEKNPCDINFSTKRVYMFTEEGYEATIEQLKKMYRQSPSGKFYPNYMPTFHIGLYGTDFWIKSLVRKNVGTEEHPKYRYFKEA